MWNHSQITQQICQKKCIEYIHQEEINDHPVAESSGWDWNMTHAKCMRHANWKWLVGIHWSKASLSSSLERITTNNYPAIKWHGFHWKWTIWRCISYENGCLFRCFLSLVYSGQQVKRVTVSHRRPEMVWSEVTWTGKTSLEVKSYILKMVGSELGWWVKTPTKINGETRKPTGLKNGGLTSRATCKEGIKSLPYRSLTASFPLKSYRNSMGKDRLPTSMAFRGKLAVKLRGCIPSHWSLFMDCLQLGQFHNPNH